MEHKTTNQLLEDLIAQVESTVELLKSRNTGRITKSVLLQAAWDINNLDNSLANTEVVRYLKSHGYN